MNPPRWISLVRMMLNGLTEPAVASRDVGDGGELRIDER